MIYNLSIKAIETALPKNSFKISSLKKKNPTWDIKKIIAKTDIEKIWYTRKNQTALDLAFEASKKVLKKINKESIDTLIYVTQSPEYFLPTTACILQHKLGLNNRVKAFDINLGCSGFVYALFVASSLAQNNMSKNILIVCADTYTKYIENSDRTNKTIFSDGASASLVSRSKKKCFGNFLMGTDGSGFKDLIVENGASKSGFTNKKKLEAEDLISLNFEHGTNIITSFKATTRADANYRSSIDIIGEKGRLLINGISLNTLQVCIICSLFLLILCIYKYKNNIMEFIKKIKDNIV